MQELASTSVYATMIPVLASYQKLTPGQTFKEKTCWEDLRHSYGAPHLSTAVIGPIVSSNQPTGAMCLSSSQEPLKVLSSVVNRMWCR